MNRPAPDVASRNAARHFVERYDIVPPLDPYEVLAGFAEVHRLYWPHEHVDAFIQGMTSTGRPKVYIRETDNPLRERFTAAHELAHIVLPWHLPAPNCTVGSGEGESELPNPSLEEEADLFASCVLVPDRWLAHLIDSHDQDMTAILNDVSGAQVSTIAALNALRRYLLSGWVFVAYGTTILSTPGTQLPRGVTTGHNQPKQQVSVAVKELRESAHDFASTKLNDYDVLWFRLSESESLPSRRTLEMRTDHQILVSAIRACGYGEGLEDKIVRSANGKVGGALRSAAGRPATELYAAMCHRLADWQFAELLDNDDFRLWLAERCRGIHAGTTNRRRNQRS